ncbi:GDP-mannose 4,6-dehydratase [Sporolactobacillus sp. Y61]|uniref:GDP-mannose 4,6-dehydratase n=1 Tax=Sporolactobacillus sp. Y61 TaxID=3160863 RepID=A0AAU8II74_9BACL
MNILITGAHGFIAKHLASKLKASHHKVILTSHTHFTHEQTCNMVIKMDLLDLNEIMKVINKIKPDVIMHLAAQSSIPRSWKDPMETVRVNTLGTTNIILAAGILHLKTKMIIVGSSEEYGSTAVKKTLLVENDPCFPQNPYAVSKLAAEQLGTQMSKKYQLNIVFLRPFNHFGPGQKIGFVISDFCSQIAKIEQNLLPPEMIVGNVLSYRDFLALPDVIDAYYLAIEKDLPNGVYNISSGKAVSIQSILMRLLKLSRKAIRIKKGKFHDRTAEINSFAGDSTKFRRVTGWNPTRSINEYLKVTLDWWRDEIERCGRDSEQHIGRDNINV